MKAELDELDDIKAVGKQLTSAVEKAMLDQLFRSYHVRNKKMSLEKIARHHGLGHMKIK